MSYVITLHAKDRFLERYGKRLPPDMGVYGYFKECLRNAKDEKSFLNDTEFMTYTYERHGYDNYICKIFEDIIFLIRGNTVVTVMGVDMFPVKVNKKFKKKEPEQEVFDYIDPKLERLVLSGRIK